MLPTEPFSSAPASGSGDLATRTSSRTTGRRRAVASSTFEPVGPPLSFDAAVSPRRAARAAREAAAAASMSAAAATPGSAVPVSPVVAPEPAAAAAPTAAAAPVAEAPVAPAAAAEEPAAPAAAAPVRPAASTAATPTSPAAAALAPVPFAGSLAIGIPAPASSTGRRETFVPAPVDRAATRAATGSAVVRRRPAASAAVAPTRARSRSIGRVAGRIAVSAVIVGIVATTCILPAIGHTGASKAYASTNADGSTTVHIGNQTYDVAAGVDNQVLARDGYSATSVVDYETQVIANRKAEVNTTYTGPTAAEYVQHPLYSHDPLDRSQVFDVALQYLGTPYVHGGADPSAFDCSGFIMFVYAQFGISLPHYVPSQDAIGTTIPQSEAVPGDLVIFDNDDHDGFYAGNGMIMDAPKPGGFITVRPIWNQPHHFVRINP